MQEQEIIKIAEQTINRIKSADNPYKDMRFVSECLEGVNPFIQTDVKNILQEKFCGQLSESKFHGKLTAAQHLYNYLYENNLLSKYSAIAEYMNYPSLKSLTENEAYSEDANQHEDEGQLAERIANKAIDALIEKKTLIIPDKDFPKELERFDLTDQGFPDVEMIADKPKYRIFSWGIKFKDAVKFFGTAGVSTSTDPYTIICSIGDYHTSRKE